MSEETNLEQLGQQIESLVQKVEAIADPALQADVLALVQGIMDLHRAGLERMFETLLKAGDPGRQLIEAISDDELAGNLLLLHGLHPADIEQRVQAAINKLDSSLQSQGGSVTLLHVENGIVRVQLDQPAQQSGCGSTAAALERVVQNAIYAAAPDAVTVEVISSRPRSQPLIQLEVNSIGQIQR